MADNGNNARQVIDHVTVGNETRYFQDSNTKGAIAPDETSPAGSAHAVGDYFFYNGDLCRAKTAIAQGDTLVLNTNYETAVVGENLGKAPMIGASAQAAGASGAVPAPAAGDDIKALFGDGTFKQIMTSMIKHTDVSGVLGTANADVLLDAFLEEIATRVAGKLNSSDVINQLIANSTKAVTSGAVQSAVSELNGKLDISSAGFHNSIFKGRYLGASVTKEQQTAIHNGTFNDLFIGDYWTIGGINWRIAAFNYWLYKGDTECTTNHVVLVPDTCLYNARMNTSNTTAGGYVGSQMYTTNLASAKTTINSAFGSNNILSHREYFTNAVSNTSDPAYSSAGSWYNSTVDLMNEIMIYGCQIFTNVEANGAIPCSYTIDNSQLPLFSLAPEFICNSRSLWWLRDVVSSSYFADVHRIGDADYSNASDSYGVRPCFGIKY